MSSVLSEGLHTHTTCHCLPEQKKTGVEGDLVMGPAICGMAAEENPDLCDSHATLQLFTPWGVSMAVRSVSISSLLPG